jgi:Astacin (Peptidase family M12A)
MDTIEKYTCIRFRPRSVEKDYVLIYAGSGCHSNMGKIGKKQEISLHKNGCFSKGTIMHEIIHALGYDHMHSSADRDSHIQINYENIQQAALSNFDRVDPKKFSNFGTDYDLYSVMHYNGKAFSKNGKDTIVPKNRRYSKIIGQRTGLSINDVKRINNMYNCT